MLTETMRGFLDWSTPEFGGVAPDGEPGAPITLMADRDVWLIGDKENPAGYPMLRLQGTRHVNLRNLRGDGTDTAGKTVAFIRLAGAGGTANEWCLVENCFSYRMPWANFVAQGWWHNRSIGSSFIEFRDCNIDGGPWRDKPDPQYGEGFYFGTAQPGDVNTHSMRVIGGTISRLTAEAIEGKLDFRNLLVENVRIEDIRLHADPTKSVPVGCISAGYSRLDQAGSDPLGLVVRDVIVDGFRQADGWGGPNNDWRFPVVTVGRSGALIERVTAVNADTDCLVGSVNGRGSIGSHPVRVVDCRSNTENIWCDKSDAGDVNAEVVDSEEEARAVIGSSALQCDWTDPGQLERWDVADGESMWGSWDAGLVEVSRGLLTLTAAPAPETNHGRGSAITWRPSLRHGHVSARLRLDPDESMVTTGLLELVTDNREGGHVAIMASTHSRFNRNHVESRVYYGGQEVTHFWDGLRASDWHTYEAEWENGRVRFRVDQRPWVDLAFNGAEAMKPRLHLSVVPHPLFENSVTDLVRPAMTKPIRFECEWMKVQGR